MIRQCLSMGVLAVALLGCKKTPPPEPAAPEPTPAVAEPVVAEPVAVTPEPEPEPEPEPTKPDLSPKVNEAVALLTVGSPEAASRALSMLTKLRSQDDTLASIHYNMGVAHALMGRQDKARAAFEGAVERDPSMGVAWLGIGVTHERSGSDSRAVQTYRDGIASAPDSVELRVALIGALRRQGRLGEAIDEAKAALAINSKSLMTYNELALVYVAKGDFDMAYFVYQKAMKQVDGAVNNAAMLCNYGHLLYLRGERARAQNRLEASKDIDPGYFPMLVHLSRLYLEDHNWGDSVVLLETAHKQQPDNRGVVLNLGVAYRGSGKLDDAKRLYNKALAMDPKDPDPYMNLGVLHGDYYKSYDEAIKSFESYLSHGGTERDLVNGYIEAVGKEQARAEKAQSRADAKKQRDADKAERERLLKAAEEKEKAAAPPPADKPEPSSDGQSAPPPAGEDNPWGK